MKREYDAHKALTHAAAPAPDYFTFQADKVALDSLLARMRQTIRRDNPGCDPRNAAFGFEVRS